MLFSKNKKEVIGLFEDDKGKIFQLVKENHKRWLDKKDDKGIEEVLLYNGSESIPPWEAPNIKLNLSKSTVEAINCFVEDYLKSSANIKFCLQRMQFPMGSLVKIWNGLYKDNEFITHSILSYQDVLPSYEFIEGLPLAEKWIVFTQNKHRSKENMTPYESMYKEVVADFLHGYLSKDNIDKYERVYGEWKVLISQTFKEYYSEQSEIESVQMAIDKTNKEIQTYEAELQTIQEHVSQLDKEYEEASISQKLKLENTVKEVLEKEKEKQEEIKDATEKLNRIKAFL